jgi:hypothetical protein
MPRKKQINEGDIPIIEDSKRIMPDFKRGQRGDVHVTGFLVLLMAATAAIAAIYYFGIKDFLAGDSQWASLPSRKETQSNVKTYSNSTYGFEFQYPSSFRLNGDFDKDKSITLLESVDGDGGSVQFEFINKPIVDARGDIATQYEGKIITAKDIKFNGYDAREIIYRASELGSGRFVLISRSSGTFKITHLAGTFEDVLSTFKFTNSSPTADWKTYTNTQYGFEVKYPSTWTAKPNYSGSSFKPSVISLLSPEALKASTPYQKNKMDINVYSLAELNDIHKFNSNNLEDYLNANGTDVVSYSKSTLNGVNAYDAKEAGLGTYFAIYIERDAKIYQLFFDAIGSRAELSETEKEILSTFKFTK